MKNIVVETLLPKDNIQTWGTMYQPNPQPYRTRNEWMKIIEYQFYNNIEHKWNRKLIRIYQWLDVGLLAKGCTRMFQPKDTSGIDRKIIELLNLVEPNK